MAEVQCPNCRAPASAEAAFCGSCGASLSAIKVATMASAPSASSGGASPLPTPVMGAQPSSAAPAPQPAQPSMPTPQPSMPTPQAMPSGQPAAAPPPMGGQSPPASTMPPTAGATPATGTIPPPSQFFKGFGPAAGPETPQVLANRQMARGAFPMRLLSFLVDGVIVGIVAAIIGGLWVSIGVWGGPLFWITDFVLYGLYKMFLEGNGGQTVGKMLFSLKVVRDDGQPMTMQQSQWRAIGAFLYVLIIPAILDFIWAAEVGMTLGDRWAHTAVIRVQ